MNPTQSASDTSQGEVPPSTTALIVGGGPVGILTSIALALYGLESVIVEKHATRLGQPKAHVLNARSAEILRQYGLDLETLRGLGLSAEESETVIFASAMNGIEYRVYATGVNGPIAKAASPVQTFNLPQPLLEERLLDLALATGKVTYFARHHWVNCEEDLTTKDITSTILLRDTDTKQLIVSRYLIASDGSNATSRNILQIPFQTLDGGPEKALHYVSVHFSADLSRFKPAVLWFILNHTGMGVFIAYNRKNNWVYTMQYDPAITPPETFTSEFLKAQTSPKIAEPYRSKLVPHAFLLGDAAHTSLPTGGLGLNSGIADSHNLAWKIYAVEKGWAPDDLLGTLTSERSAVARANANYSMTNEAKAFSLTNLISKRGMILEELWAKEGSRKAIQGALEDQREHFDSLNLMIGYVYGRDNVRGPSDYQKECVPGARLPHEWVVRGSGNQVSSLDLVDLYAFTLFAPSGFTTVESMNIKGVPVKVVQRDRDFNDLSGEFTAIMGLVKGNATLVRPDQHIVGSMLTMKRVSEVLTSYLNGKQ